MLKNVKGLIMLVVFIMLGFGMFFKIENNDQLIQLFGYAALTIASGSMENELHVGDIIIIKKCEDYKVGDIITYNVNDDYLVTHRIIQESEEGFVTKGDNNNIADDLIVQQENVKGKVVHKIRLLKWSRGHFVIGFVGILMVLILW